MMNTIYFILVLSIIVIVHEIGHLLTAKLFHVYCYEFAIGMGPKLFSYQGKETKYSVRLIPIGGFVSMAGEQDAEQELFPDINVPSNRTIKGIAPWKKIIIMGAGVVMNLILCWVIISGILMHNGAYGLSPKPIVDSIVENSPAETAGFQTGDEIKKVVFDDGTVIKPKSFDDIVMFTQTYGGKMTYTVQRDHQLIELQVQGIKNEDNMYMVGIGIPARTVVKINPLNAWYYSADYIGDMTSSIIKSLGRLVQGNGLEQLSGPVGIYQITAQQASMGIENLLILIAMFSLNVGIFNLIPIPILDGGRILITIGEWITGKELNKKIEAMMMSVGLVLMVGLFIFATWQDIVRLLFK